MFKCRECRSAIEHVGICSKCGDGIRLREHWVALGPSLASIPERYRWARWGSDMLYDRVPDLSDLTIHPTELLAYPILLIHGESGAGKTSFATALYRLLADQASPDSVPAILDRARRARFVDARDVPTPRTPADGIPGAVAARLASVLLLDDVGQEAGEGSPYAAQERRREMGDLLEFRYKHELPIIVTTYGTVETWTASYGAGVARRYWESDDAKVIELRRRA